MLYQSYSNILIRLRKPAISEPDDIGKSIYLKRKPRIVVDEISFEIESTSIMRGSRGPFTNYITHLRWVSGQQRCNYCKLY